VYEKQNESSLPEVPEILVVQIGSASQAEYLIKTEFVDYSLNLLSLADHFYL